ncbi:hypothetical protein OpiT1DRAFT_02580 [Opitutaceae bacterium TAV1]|nr:hypothetical protein OpiT1DRAFT_02580 [Opitutaceae bacterium TAV1]
MTATHHTAAHSATRDVGKMDTQDGAKVVDSGEVAFSVNTQPAARSPQPAARSPQPAARSPQPAARSPQPAARSPLKANGIEASLGKEARGQKPETRQSACPLVSGLWPLFSGRPRLSPCCGAASRARRDMFPSRRSLFRDRRSMFRSRRSMFRSRRSLFRNHRNRLQDHRNMLRSHRNMYQDRRNMFRDRRNRFRSQRNRLQDCRSLFRRGRNGLPPLRIASRLRGGVIHPQPHPQS